MKNAFVPIWWWLSSSCRWYSVCGSFVWNDDIRKYHSHCIGLFIFRLCLSFLLTTKCVFIYFLSSCVSFSWFSLVVFSVVFHILRLFLSFPLFWFDSAEWPSIPSGSVSTGSYGAVECSIFQFGYQRWSFLKVQLHILSCTI